MKTITYAFLTLLILTGALPSLAAPPNIIWVIIEDASPHINPYGETAIRTPNLNRMAQQGLLFENAYVTNPVCSPSRSAMVSGMYQTTLGAHNHRSQDTTEKAGGNVDYYDSYRVPEGIELVPELFRKAGYHVTNGGKGKKDYNFIARTEVYDEGRDWSGRQPGQPFFSQVQLHGGKNRGAKVSPMTDPAKVTLPPYYPDHPVLREDWARYLNSWVYVDNEVGKLFKRLRDEGITDNTAVFLWTDHGVSHLRGKQFLYEEGIRVPLIAWFGDATPHATHRGKTRADLVSHIDIAATSLALAGIDIPGYVQGQDLFADDFTPRRFAFAARDRCDETTDIIRAIRTQRYKYIRNFRNFRAHAQPNQYKDGKEIVQKMRSLHTAGKLNELQARPFAPTRPIEELYDLVADPHETVNLAASPEHARILAAHRAQLYSEMITTRDMGLVPEPILEDLGNAYGSKHAAMAHPDQTGLTRHLQQIVDAGAHANTDALNRGLSSERPSARYWAAIGLGNTGRPADTAPLDALLNDPNPTVRIAAARSLLVHRKHPDALEAIVNEIHNPNLVVGLYAMRAIEEIGDHARGAAPAVLKARQSPYNTTVRIANRLTAQWGLGAK
ncbi:MAG: sulfatase-like hydrolase/transferase [Planctomycetota bacterium]|jgi:arylsulfatase A-like enzyme